jgi:pimeloyl-ACP methyl ester carboxylesterase
MECDVAGTPVHYVERGDGVPVLALHGAGVDHRELLAALEPAFDDVRGFRRIYPDLPGMGRTPALPAIQSADDVLDVLLGLADSLIGDQPFAVVGHSAGAYYAQAIAEVRRDRAVGMALICPLTPGVRDVPSHEIVHVVGDLGEDYATPRLAEFRGYFVVHTPEMIERYISHVEPSLPLADIEALRRIADRWTLSSRPGYGERFEQPALIVTGRQDSTVGYAGPWDLVERYPRATFATLDRAGHALPHEQPDLLSALVREWLERVSEQVPP